MKRPADQINPQPTRGKASRKPSLAKTDGYWERTGWASFLAAHVKEKGLFGSRLVKEFALYRAFVEADAETERGHRRTLEQAEVALAEWGKLSHAEKRRILRGWHVTEQPPGYAEFLRYIGRFKGELVEWMLTAHVDYEGRVSCFADWGMPHNTAAVQAQIRPGSEKQEVLSELRRITAGLEKDWPAAIALEGREGLTIAVPQGQAAAAWSPDAAFVNQVMADPVGGAMMARQLAKCLCT